MPATETLAEGGDADFDKAAQALVVDEQFREIVNELRAEAPKETPKNPETHSIYAGLGETALIKPKIPSQGRNITPQHEYYPHRHHMRASELRALGGLSAGQRRHLR
jgi:hypothetical protein